MLGVKRRDNATMSFKVLTPYNKDKERKEEGCSNLLEPQKKKKNSEGPCEGREVCVEDYQLESGRQKMYQVKESSLMLQVPNLLFLKNKH